MQERSRILTGWGSSRTRAATRQRELTELQKKANGDLEAETTKLKRAGEPAQPEVAAAADVQRSAPRGAEAVPERDLRASAAVRADEAEDQQQAQFAKQNAAEAERAANAAERERKERERQARDPQFQSAALLKEFEGFTRRRSSTATRSAPASAPTRPRARTAASQKVTANTVVSMADATRDLERRVLEFQNVVKQQIGGERFAEFSARQQAALTSIAYNYGKLPDRIVEAVKHGTNGQIAAAVRGLAGDNNGINRGAATGSRHPRHDNLAVDQGAAQALADIETERLKIQTQFDEKVKEENDTRRQDISQLQAQKGLIGDALLAEQKKRVHRRRDPEERAGDCQAQRRARSAGQAAHRLHGAGAGRGSGSRRRLLRPRARQGCREQRARCRRQPVQDDLSAQRDALEQRIQFLRENGDAGMAQRASAARSTRSTTSSARQSRTRSSSGKR
jgi:GH24 family phage-related lysozyme (muramidase)